MGDLTHRRAGCFSHDRDQVIVLLDAVDVQTALLEKPGRCGRRNERFDEDAHGNETVGEYDMRDALAAPAKLAPAFHDLLEARRHAGDDPARILRYDVTR